jgi:NADP-dependent 3-hydroxy acid dehydrogenase YdfG
LAGRAQWKTVWITGASSGIGLTLTEKLAARGARVAASARSADKLAGLARANPQITPFPLDVTDRAAVAATAAAIRDKLGPIDLAILNAGIWEPTGAKEFTAEAAQRTMDVNFQGVANGVAAVLPDMIARRSGHVAMVSSVAGYIGLPLATTYSPSKAAVIALAQSLQHQLYDANVKVSIINPGYIETPMTKVNTFPMPYLMPVDAAAERIIAGLERGKFEIAFPWQVVKFLKLGRAIPYRLFSWYLRTFMS